MSWTPGTLLGAYEVRTLLGVGGMGEVYRARDTRLNRDVALKALPVSFTKDPERVARFRREAQLLASLNHPHIGAIYGLEEVEGRQILVLELVEGGTLAQRISAGPLPVAETVAIAQQIAEALEAAHERAIVHRDLKPANIALTADDRVKVLDFGLAKAAGPDPSSPDLGDSPTLTIGATQAGVILGTAAYMSPEQAKGRAADQRSDVWAFGCVLFEMLTGRRAFEGEDASDTLAAVLRADPDWGLLPADLSDAIRVLVKRCLVKDRHARVANLGVARFVMSEATIAQGDGRSAPRPPALAAKPAPRLNLLQAAGGLILGGAVVAAAAAAIASRPVPAVKASVARFSIAPPAVASLVSAASSGDRLLAISPDGTMLVYRGGAAAAQTQLFVRNLNELETRPLAGTIGGRQPFFSPDGRSIGFFTYDALMRVPASGGTPTQVCRIPAGLVPAGAAWGEDGTIVFAMRQRGIVPGTPGLQRVSASGGEPTTLTTPDVDNSVIAHTNPSWLPGSDAVIFTSAGSRGRQGVATANIAIIDLKTGRQEVLLSSGGFNPEYIDSGHILFVNRSGALHAVGFDLARREIVGSPVTLAEQVKLPTTGDAQLSLSRTGTLIFLPADEATRGAEVRSLVWVDRDGREEPIPVPSRSYAIPRLSPDGSRIAIDARDQGSDIWIWDFARQSLARLTTDPTLDIMPIWTPDSSRIIWTTNRASPNPNLHWQSADGTGQPERLSESAVAQFPTSVSPDGQQVVFFDAPGQTLVDMHRLTLAGTRTRTAMLEGPGVESNGEVSPDGHWLAYESDESGQFEVYVRPFPTVDASRLQVSSQGGSRPAWSRNGAELFYLDKTDRLTSVAVKPSATAFASGLPKRILDQACYPGFSTRGFNLRGYDVSADGKRFLMLKEPVAGADPGQDAPTITVVVNWLEELTARLSAAR